MKNHAGETKLLYKANSGSAISHYKHCSVHYSILYCDVLSRTLKIKTSLWWDLWYRPNNYPYEQSLIISSLNYSIIINWRPTMQ